MNKLILFIIACVLFSCTDDPQREIIPAVPPGTLTALFTNEHGTTVIISQDSAKHIHFGSKNILRTPPGAHFMFKLPDNSSITLNAASSITIYQYDQNKRIIELSGEAYFELATNTTVPFEVRTAGVTISAFGTTFNVLSYMDEPERKVTLIEGTLQVKSTASVVSLKPGQQATLNKNLQVQVADQKSTLSWKEGYYDASSLGSLIRQISRWYGLTPVFTKNPPRISFDGQIPLSTDLPTILSILQANGITLKHNAQLKQLIYYS